MSTDMVMEEPPAQFDEVEELTAAVMSFVRNFGLLQPDHTPCGMSLSVSQAHALREIEVRPGITQRDLTSALGLSPATVSELVANLVEQDWLDQAPAKVDRRQRCLTLTEVGTGVAADIAGARRSLISDMVQTLNSDQRKLVVEATQLLAEGAQRCRHS